MPHVILEHSPNLAQRVDMEALVHAVHAAVLATGLAPQAGLRTRSLAAGHAEVADGDPRNCYLAATARLGPGRSPDEQRRLLETLADTVEAQLGEVCADTAISVEYQEIDADLRINRNGLRSRLEQS